LRARGKQPSRPARGSAHSAAQTTEGGKHPSAVAGVHGFDVAAAVATNGRLRPNRGQPKRATRLQENGERVKEARKGRDRASEAVAE
jgi:hypothetical protein